MFSGSDHAPCAHSFLPPNFRVQIDGVSTNWGKTSLAHLDYLVKGAVVDVLTAVRNPVGNTHEDIDAIFALLRNVLINRDVLSVDDLMSVIDETFPGRQFGPLKLPVAVLFVDATFDYISFYAQAGALDPKLANFSYSQYQSGYHVFNSHRSAEAGSLCGFKKYQQDNFLTIAISRDEVMEIPDEDRPAIPDPFFPIELIIKNKCARIQLLRRHLTFSRLLRWEQATVLLSKPDGKPAIAAVEPYDYDRVLRDAMHVIPDTADHVERRRKWHEFIGQRPRTTDDVRVRFMAQLPKWDWPSRAHDPIPVDQGARPTGLSCYAAVYEQPRSVTSSLHDGAEGAAARRRAGAARGDRADSEAAERRDPLTPGDFVFAMANWTNSEGFQIPMILLEMPADFEGKDTTDPELIIKPKWSESTRCASLLLSPRRASLRTALMVCV